MFEITLVSAVACAVIISVVCFVIGFLIWRSMKKNGHH